MERKGRLPFSQAPATGPYPEPDESKSTPHWRILYLSDPF
jgi:hypothetical protein